MEEAALETVEIDGEPWKIRQALDDFWLGHGGMPQTRGCIVSARSREALVAEIPKARDLQLIGFRLHKAEAAIVTAFKSVLDSELQGRYLENERKSKLAQIVVLCAEMWPWVFAPPEPEAAK